MAKASARLSASALKRLMQNRPAANDSEVARAAHRPDLFSDLNQWMLKVLIGQRLPETLIAVPRDPVRNASQLAMWPAYP